MATYEIGTAVRRKANIKDADGNDTDPAALTVTYGPQGGSFTTKTYVTDPEVVKASVGNYYIDIEATEEGRWWVKWDSTTPDVVSEDWFFVDTTEAV